MATSKSRGDSEKKVDLPPRGPANRDPISKAPGSHPIETGVGTAVGGAAAGFAAGMAAGPVGAAVGAIGGGIIGGLAGKGIGEMIDPTTEDQWVREYYDSRPDSERSSDRGVEDYRGPYHYGLAAKSQFGDRRFEEIEPNLRSDWDRNKDSQRLSWDEARPAIQHAYCRRIETPNRKT